MPNEAAVEVVTPVVPVAPVEQNSGTDPPAGSDAAPPVEAEKEEPKPEAKPERLLSQDEVNRIVRRERKAAEERAYSRARAEAAEKRLQEFESQARGETPTQTGNGETEPRPDNFKDWDEYTRARVRWEVRQAAREESQGRQRQLAQSGEAQYAEAVRGKLAIGEEKYEDFNAVVTDPDVAFTPPMINAILDTSAPHDVAYFIGTHPKDSHRIAAMSPANQVREIDKIAATLTKPPTPTNAPAPIKPNSGSGGVEKTLEAAGGNYKEWLKVRERQLAQK